MGKLFPETALLGLAPLEGQAVLGPVAKGLKEDQHTLCYA